MSKRLPIHLGLSPCPNDTFIFHAFLHGLTPVEYKDEIEILPYLADVEKLNKNCSAGRLEVTKLSLGVVPSITENYALLSTGAALGWGCGPLVVSAQKLTPKQMKDAVMAIPGRFTTANLLLDLHGGFHGPRQEMLFSEIIPAVARGDVDAGIIIHEGRFTYANHGLLKLLDMGEWWEKKYSLPLPLGAIAVRRDVDLNLAKSIERAIAASLDYAWKNPTASADFVRQNAQELDEAVTRAHIETFVTQYSYDLGETGRAAIMALMTHACPNMVKNLFI